MYKILIVDDEIISRLGLSNLLKWEEYGFEVIETASHGAEALEILEKYQIDLIITDVSMPIMNGLDLIKEVKNVNEEIEFLILSSYEEFTYVREAMRLGVVDYILKLDLSEESMARVLKNIKTKLDNKAKKNTEGKRYLSQRELSLMRREVLRKILYGQIENYDTIEEYCKNVGIEFSLPYAQILMFEMNGVSADIESDNIIDIIEEILDDYNAAYACFTGLNEITIVYQLEKNIENRVEIEDLANRIHQLIYQYFDQEIQIFISTVLEEKLNFVKGYKEVKEICEEHNILDKTKYLFYEDIKKETKNGQRLIGEKILSDLHHLFEEERIEDIPLVFDKIYAIVKEKRYLERNQVKYMLEYILQISKEYFIKNKLWIKELEIQWGDYQKEIKNINDSKSLLLFLKKIEHIIMTYLEKEDSNHLIRRAQQYIRVHYRENMSIKDMAFELGVSHTYLSTLFKQKKSITIKDYCIKLQIEEAKKLLRTSNMQVVEIANFVGYENEHYFSRIFKLKTGISPTKWRNNEKNEIK